IALYQVKIQVLIRLLQFYFPHRGGICGKFNFRKQLLCNGSRHYPAGGFPGRRPSAAPVVAEAVLLVVGEVGMRRAVSIFVMGVILRFLVGVLDDKANGRAGAFAFKDTRKEFHRVGLLSLRHYGRLTRSSSVQLLLDGLLVYLQTGRTAVDDPPDGIAMGFPESSELKKFPEGISGHLE